LNFKIFKTYNKTFKTARPSPAKNSPSLWYDTPALRSDTRYWKTPSGGWFWGAMFLFALALIENILLPPAANAVFLLNNAGLSGAERFLRRYFYCIFLAAFILVWTALYFFYRKRGKEHKRKKLYHKAQFTFACGAALAVWEVLTVNTRRFPVPYCPGFSEIFCVIFDDRRLLLISTAYSMRLFFAGLVTGVALGLGTGICVGWSKQWDYWLSPVIRVSGIIPAVAWLPVALLILPNSFTTGLFLIFVASWFPVSSTVAAGIRSTPRSYFEAARTFGADNRFLLFKIAIPNAMPGMFTGIMTATAFSFTTLIVSEMVGAKAGLGYYINWAKGWGNYSKVYAALIIIAVEFSLILSLINIVRNRVLRWQKGIVL